MSIEFSTEEFDDFLRYVPDLTLDDKEQDARSRLIEKTNAELREAEREYNNFDPKPKKWSPTKIRICDDTYIRVRFKRRSVKVTLERILRRT